eukprot:979563_1
MSEMLFIVAPLHCQLSSIKPDKKSPRTVDGLSQQQEYCTERLIWDACCGTARFRKYPDTWKRQRPILSANQTGIISRVAAFATFALRKLRKDICCSVNWFPLVFHSSQGSVNPG